MLLQLAVLEEMTALSLRSFSLSAVAELMVKLAEEGDSREKDQQIQSVAEARQ